MRVERSQQVRREPDRHPRRHTNIQRTLSHVRHNTSQKYNNPAPVDATQAGEEDSARLLRAEGTQPRTMVRHARVRVKWLLLCRLTDNVSDMGFEYDQIHNTWQATATITPSGCILLNRWAVDLLGRPPLVHLSTNHRADILTITAVQTVGGAPHLHYWGLADMDPRDHTPARRWTIHSTDFLKRKNLYDGWWYHYLPEAVGFTLQISLSEERPYDGGIDEQGSSLEALREYDRNPGLASWECSYDTVEECERLPWGPTHGG